MSVLLTKNRGRSKSAWLGQNARAHNDRAKAPLGRSACRLGIQLALGGSQAPHQAHMSIPLSRSAGAARLRIEQELHIGQLRLQAFLLIEHHGY